MPPAHRDVVINAFVFVHLSLHQANSRVSKRGGRTMAITPRHYLDFINHFVSLPLLLYSILLGKLAIMSRLMEGHYFGGIPSLMQIRTIFIILCFPETDWNFYRLNIEVKLCKHCQLRKYSQVNNQIKIIK